MRLEMEAMRFRKQPQVTSLFPTQLIALQSDRSTVYHKLENIYKCAVVTYCYYSYRSIDKRDKTGHRLTDHEKIPTRIE